jgi:hypothetical protein
VVDAFGIEEQLHRDEVMPERIGPPFGIAQDLVEFAGLFFGDDFIESPVDGEESVIT